MKGLDQNKLLHQGDIRSLVMELQCQKNSTSHTALALLHFSKCNLIKDRPLFFPGEYRDWGKKLSA